MVAYNLIAVITVFILLACVNRGLAQHACINESAETCTRGRHQHCVVSFPSLDAANPHLCKIIAQCSNRCFTICFAIRSTVVSNNPETLYKLKIDILRASDSIVQRFRRNNLTSVQTVSEADTILSTQLTRNGRFVRDRKFEMEVTYDCTHELQCVELA